MTAKKPNVIGVAPAVYSVTSMDDSGDEKKLPPCVAQTQSLPPLAHVTIPIIKLTRWYVQSQFSVASWSV